MSTGLLAGIEPNSCNCAALRKASRRMSQFYDAALAPCGLKSTQFAVLAEIERRAEMPPTIRDLAERLVMDQSTIGQNLRPLEREGLIALVTDASDPPPGGSITETHVPETRREPIRDQPGRALPSPATGCSGSPMQAVGLE